MQLNVYPLDIINKAVKETLKRELLVRKSQELEPYCSFTSYI